MLKVLFNIDTWQEIYASLSKNKVRTIITTIGVFWGMFLMVSLLGIATGLRNKFKHITDHFAPNSLFLWTGKTSIPFHGYGKDRRITFTESELSNLKRKFDDRIAYLSPRMSMNAIVTKGERTSGVKMNGDLPDYRLIFHKDLIRGRFINQNDSASKRKVCVISVKTRDEIFNKGVNPIGKSIKIDQTNYTIIGVWKPTSNIRFESKTLVHIPLSTFKEIYGSVKIAVLSIAAYEDVNLKNLYEDLLRYLKKTYHVHPKDERAFNHFNVAQRLDKINIFSRGLVFLTWFIGITTLIAGTFSIGNILLITIKERTKEIGIRRAIGATPKDIKGQILFESVFLTCFAGILGIIASGGLLYATDWFMQKQEDAALLNTTVNLYILFSCLAILVVVGGLIGMIPASIATKIKPIEALREE